MVERRFRSSQNNYCRYCRRWCSDDDIIINMAKIQPRGIRNNNPLNIRIGNTWLGEKDNPTDKEFEEFVSMEYGLRAAFLILRRYIRRYQLNTVSLIISTWAPASENNTLRYIDTVCARTGLTPSQQIKYEDKETMCRLVAEMAIVECGQPIDFGKIEKGYDMT